MPLQPSDTAAEASGRCCAPRHLTALVAAAVVAGLLLVLTSSAPLDWVLSRAARRWSTVQRSLQVGAHGGLRRIRSHCGDRCWRRGGLTAARLRGLTPTAGGLTAAIAVPRRQGAGKVVPGAQPALQPQAVAAAASRDTAATQPAQRQPERQKQPAAAAAARHVPKSAPGPPGPLQSAAMPRSEDGIVGGGGGGSHRGGADAAPRPPPPAAEPQQAAPPSSMAAIRTNNKESAPASAPAIEVVILPPRAMLHWTLCIEISRQQVESDSLPCTWPCRHSGADPAGCHVHRRQWRDREPAHDRLEAEPSPSTVRAAAQVAAAATRTPPAIQHEPDSPPASSGPHPPSLPLGGAINAPVGAAGRLTRHLDKILVVARYREDIGWLDALRPRIPFLVYQVRAANLGGEL